MILDWLPTIPIFPPFSHVTPNESEQKIFFCGQFRTSGDIQIGWYYFLILTPNLICTRMCTRIWMSIENLRLESACVDVGSGEEWLLMRLHCIICSHRVGEHFPSQFKRRKWLQVLRGALTSRGNVVFACWLFSISTSSDSDESIEAWKHCDTFLFLINILACEDSCIDRNKYLH